MSKIKLKEGATVVDLSVDDRHTLAQVEKAGRFFSTSILHNESLRRLAEQGLIELDAPKELHQLHTASTKGAADPDEGTGG